MLTRDQLKKVVGGVLSGGGCYECITNDYDPFTGTGSSTTIQADSQGAADAACPNGVAHMHPVEMIC